MRTLTVLSLLQTVCLLFLVMNAIGGRQDAALSSITPESTAPIMSVADTPNAVTSPAKSADEALIRRVIQEELAPLLAASEVDTRMVPPQEREPRDARADRRQRDYVNDQLSYYESLGAITNEEMNALHREIGKLSPADRRAVLSRLMQALNSGAIEGQL